MEYEMNTQDFIMSMLRRRQAFDKNYKIPEVELVDPTKLVYARDIENEFAGGKQRIYRFTNGYGASVVYNATSYGLELAVIEWMDPDDNDSWDLCYDTEITDDVLGYLTKSELEKALNRISTLPPRRKVDLPKSEDIPSIFIPTVKILDPYKLDYVKDILKPHTGIMQRIYRFTNGYGASVIYIELTNNLELAVIKWKDPDDEDSWELCYDTEITNDTLSDLTKSELEDLLNRISNLDIKGTAWNEKKLRRFVQKCLVNDYWWSTKSKLDTIRKILNSQAQAGVDFDLSDMIPEAISFALQLRSKNDREECLRIVEDTTFSTIQK